MNDKTIGDYLKSLREEKGLTLEEISQGTKIKIKFLQDIEKNRFDNLGGVGYAKAMSYTYGRFLDANLSHLLKLLNKRFPETILQDLEKEPEIMPKKYFLSTSFIPIIIAIIFALVFTVVIIKSRSTSKILKPKTTTEQVIKTPDKTDEKDNTIDSKVLKDTTNYLEKFMFKKKKNPFKADE